MRAFIYTPPESRAAGILAHGPRNRWVAKAGGLALLLDERVEVLTGIDLLTPADETSLSKADLVAFAAAHGIAINAAAKKAEILTAIITAAEEG